MNLSKLTKNLVVEKINIQFLSNSLDISRKVGHYVVVFGT